MTDMCGIFGFSDYGSIMTAKRRGALLHALARESEIRGTDASGIAYCSGGGLRVYKRPVPGGSLRFRLPGDVRAAIGHTRMATRGSAKRNRNNHPFWGRAGIGFALTHNGVILNDFELRGQYRLPGTTVETDSYAAVQLLEKAGELSFDFLREMAEAVRGTFTFALLDAGRNLWFVKGSNPLAVIRFDGLLVYASTRDILAAALLDCSWLSGPFQRIDLDPGDLLKIDRGGKASSDVFLTRRNCWPSWDWYDGWDWPGVGSSPCAETPLDDLLAAANSMGYSAETIERLLENGYDEMEIEDLLYEPEMMAACLAENWVPGKGVKSSCAERRFAF